MSNIYVGLVHFPVCDKAGRKIITSITNMDIHDISRSCKTYGVKNYFIINPLEGQKTFLEKVLKFWKTEVARKYNPDRVEALSLVKFAYSIDEVIDIIKKQENDLPMLITTTANECEGQVGIDKIDLYKNKKPILILFGTGNGLCEQVHKRADVILKPIKGKNKYNHLSVRSAVAIILDRLFSEK